MTDIMFGRKFNFLTVLPIPFERRKYKKYYFCKCDCGNEKWIRECHLFSGDTKSCGCYLKKVAKELQSEIAKRNFTDLSGQKFNRITVLKYFGKDKHNNIKYLCRCDCGKETVVFGDNLRRKITQSCGCIHKETMVEYNKNYRISKGKDPNVFMVDATMAERQKFKESETYKKVLKRDNYKCQFCPNVNKNLEVHHILGWAKYPKLRYKLDNLITLCKICHIPIIHNGNAQIAPHISTTKLLQQKIIENNKRIRLNNANSKSNTATTSK